MNHTTYSYKIAYLGDEVGERGRETVTVTKHPNGDRTMQALSEIFDSGVLRHVTLAVNKTWQPLECYVKISVKDHYVGSGWFYFDENTVECEAFSAEGGRLSQRLETERRTPFFIAHPVASDLWLLGAYDRSGGKVQTIKNGMMCSPLSNGASAPSLHPLDLTIEYLGKETVTVPAGTFEADHFQFILADKPAEHLWAYGEDLHLIKIRWDLLKTTYELLELHE
jgi:hypothetical protein